MEWQVPRLSSGGMSCNTIETYTPTILKKQEKNEDYTKPSSSTYSKKQSISSTSSSSKASSRKLSNSSTATSSTSGSGYQIPQYDTNYQHRYRTVSKTTTRKSIQHTTSKSYDEEDDNDLNNKSHTQNQRNSDYSDRSNGIVSKASEVDDDIDDNGSLTGTIESKKLATNITSLTSNKKKTKTPTIGLFGAYGSTGNHFLKLALDAGYNVQAMLLPSAIVHVRSNGKKLKKKTITSSSLQEEFIDYANMSSSCNTLHDKVNHGNTTTTYGNNNRLEWIKSKRVDDVNNIKRTIDNVDYVVCMLSDTIHTTDDDKTCTTKSKVGPLLNFIQLLYPLMNDNKTIQAFLYQTTSLANDIYGMTPILSKCMKSLSLTNKKLYYNIRDHDKSIQQMSFYHYTQYNNNNIDSTTFVVNNDNTNKKGSLLKKAKIGLDDDKEEIENDENIDNENDGNKRSSILSTASRPPIIRTLSCSPHFSYIITRPTSYIIDGPSKHALVSSKSVSN